MSSFLERLNLNGEWTLQYGPQRKPSAQMDCPEIPPDWKRVPAQVPGNVELDLVRAGELPADLERGHNIYKLRNLETHQWWYSRTFTAPALHLLGVGDAEASVPRPVKELKGFASVALAPGERRTIELAVTERDLRFFCPRRRAWVAEPGVFTVAIAASAADVQLTGTFQYVRDHQYSVTF